MIDKLLLGIKTFFGNEDLTRFDVITTALITTLIALLITAIWRKIASVTLSFTSRSYKTIKNRIRKARGFYNLNDLIQLEKKVKKGEKLSAKEQKVYEKSRKDIANAAKKIDFSGLIDTVQQINKMSESNTYLKKHLDIEDKK